MTQPDPLLARLPEGIELRQQGRHTEARAVMEQLWNDIGGDAAAGMGASAAALLPSLHLNLAECYRKLDQHDHARAHLQHVRAAVDDLPADEYGDTIRGPLADLAERLDRG